VIISPRLSAQGGEPHPPSCPGQEALDGHAGLPRGPLRVVGTFRWVAGSAPRVTSRAPAKPSQRRAESATSWAILGSNQ